MADDLTRARDAAAALLDHPVPLALAGEDGWIVAASIAGDPPHVRVAWVDPDEGTVLARVAGPPRRPSRFRPVVATAVMLDEPQAVDRVLVALAAPGVAAVRVHLGGRDDAPPETPVGPDGLALLRIPVDAPVVAIDALDAHGEPVGRMIGEGVSLLRSSVGSISGRLGLSHGMAAGIGGGEWVADLAEAEFAAGFAPRLPEWVPEGFTQSRPRVEPDTAYPAAPPAIIVTWEGPDNARVLVRQAPAPLASPELGGSTSREVEVGPVTGILRGRLLATLVWETDDLAFGVQVRRMDDAPDVALRVARSIPAA